MTSKSGMQFSNDYFLPQHANDYFPECGYKFTNKSYATFDFMGNGAFEMQKNEFATASDGKKDNRRIHFTPLWFPDGDYTVKSYVYDAWTPSDKLLSGDIVSCIVTENEKTSTPSELTYVEVLAVTQKDGADKQSEKRANEESEENVATVTLLANKKQAELLANYDTNAEIHLALVYRGDEKVAEKFLKEQENHLKGE